MPEGINVCIENLDEGSGIAQSFIDQKACWHKSCNLKLNRTKLDRAEKPTSHERIDNKATTSKKKTRHSFFRCPPVTRLCAYSVMKMAKKPFMSPQQDVQGVVQTFDQSEPMLKCQSKRVSLLPESYSNLPPAVLRFSEPDIPLVEGELSIDMSSFPAALKGEFKWLNSCG
ncbi:unnamed protein product [Mytilus edulis]|uniref:Uncharacterized protein n=1 Tax=Mytilus edulis TaxID=6550 RepID=A0A8S3SFZ6_MYTED|nr:unnamed protein product [Mytilus edulis]